MKVLRGLLLSLGVLAIVVFCVVVGAIGSCFVGGIAWGPGLGREMLIGALVGLAVGVATAIYCFRR